MKLKQIKTELLAPAKDLSTAIEAINYGADAVYIGASNFGARYSASNNIEDIKKLVEYAHKFYVKVHVTVNTILTDNEIIKAKALIKKLYDIGVDAIIVQDMGIVNLAKKGYLPPIVLHASTQCDNRNLEKVKFFEHIGLSRVILARELSLKKIKEICQNTNIEIETFIHGALCVSYSGQCYLSCSIGGRSANRGECAQPCRKKYSLIDSKGNYIIKNKYLLSMKDFNASEYLKELVYSGVKSFKIEGRLKDTNYVKNVVLYYRKQLDKYSQKTSSGKIFSDFEPILSKSFNRNFTTYFLRERELCNNLNTPKMQGEKIGTIKNSGYGWFEIEAKTKINPQDGICYFEKEELNGCLVNKIEKNKIYINKKIKIEKETEIFRNFDFEYDKKLTKSRTTRKIGIFFKLKDNILTVKDEDLNEIKIEIKEKEIAQNKEKNKKNIKKQLQKTGESIFYVEKVEINGEPPFLPISKINEIRRMILEKLEKERSANYKREYQKNIKYTPYIKKETDYHENIHNREAEDFYKNCGCKILEKSLESQKDFKEKELIKTKYCIKYALGLCGNPEKYFLEDEKGQMYKLEFDCKKCEMTIFRK